jgi:NH3-dependent NAD+ synthetase
MQLIKFTKDVSHIVQGVRGGRDSALNWSVCQLLKLPKTYQSGTAFVLQAGVIADIQRVVVTEPDALRS